MFLKSIETRSLALVLLHNFRRRFFVNTTSLLANFHTVFTDHRCNDLIGSHYLLFKRAVMFREELNVKQGLLIAGFVLDLTFSAFHAVEFFW